MLSNLSKIPPWEPSNWEKSLIFNLLFINEKYKSPKNKDDDKINEKIIPISKKNKTRNENRKDINVPDQVFFGLINGKINGPPIFLPAK